MRARSRWRSARPGRRSPTLAISRTPQDLLAGVCHGRQRVGGEHRQREHLGQQRVLQVRAGDGAAHQHALRDTAGARRGWRSTCARELRASGRSPRVATSGSRRWNGTLVTTTSGSNSSSRLKNERGLVVQQVLPPVPRHQLRQDHGDDRVAPCVWARTAPSSSGAPMSRNGASTRSGAAHPSARSCQASITRRYLLRIGRRRKIASTMVGWSDFGVDHGPDDGIVHARRRGSTPRFAPVRRAAPTASGRLDPARMGHRLPPRQARTTVSPSAAAPPDVGGTAHHDRPVEDFRDHDREELLGLAGGATGEDLGPRAPDARLAPSSSWRRTQPRGDHGPGSASTREQARRTYEQRFEPLGAYRAQVARSLRA